MNKNQNLQIFFIPIKCEPNQETFVSQSCFPKMTKAGNIVSQPCFPKMTKAGNTVSQQSFPKVYRQCFPKANFVPAQKSQ